MPNLYGLSRYLKTLTCVNLKEDSFKFVLLSKTQWKITISLIAKQWADERLNYLLLIFKMAYRGIFHRKPEQRHLFEIRNLFAGLGAETNDEILKAIILNYIISLLPKYVRDRIENEKRASAKE